MSPVDPRTLEVLALGIKAEVAAYVFYKYAAHKREISLFRETLERLALEEKSHFRILERQYDSLVRSERWISTVDALKQNGLPDINEEMTGQHRELIEEVKQAGSLRQLLEIAYRLEEEAYELYAREAKRAPSEEARKLLSELSRFEQGHMELVNRMMLEAKGV